MLGIERILCPLSWPPESDEALRYAVSLMRCFEAKLVLCHISMGPALSESINGGADGHLERKFADSFNRLIGPPDGSNPDWEVVIVEKGKDIGEEIVRVARDQRIDLIVMSSRRSRLASLLGSIAEQVSRTASCPVLMVPPQEGELEPNRDKVFERVLVPHDFSSISELALSYALSIVQKCRAELHLMHILPEVEEDDPEVSLNEFAVETAYQRAFRRLQKAVPEAVFRCCRVTQVVRWGRPYREVLAYAKEQDIDLVCMGALGSDFGLQALFGSNVDRVVRQAMCAVLIARPFKPAVQPVVGLHVEKPGEMRAVDQRP
jgi:nucleotide-binding universal stress UspA family protein